MCMHSKTPSIFLSDKTSLKIKVIMGHSTNAPSRTEIKLHYTLTFISQYVPENIVLCQSFIVV